MTSFREELIEFARKGVALESRCHNEECTKQYLVLPFVHLLGYDPKDPEQVAAEHSADFSDKYKNRVDYLLKADGVAAIALECKSCGCASKRTGVRSRATSMLFRVAASAALPTVSIMSSSSTQLNKTKWTTSPSCRSVLNPLLRERYAQTKLKRLNISAKRSLTLTILAQQRGAAC